ncbi:hypothetical protein ACFQO4_17585 [Saliphagus sp. GCM10025334]
MGYVVGYPVKMKGFFEPAFFDEEMRSIQGPCPTRMIALEWTKGITATYD